MSSSPVTMRPDPRTLDYLDSLSPHRLNQYDPERRPYDAAMLDSPLYTALRHASGYVPYLQVIPSASKSTILARGHYEESFYIPPGGFLYAISASSPQVAGFQLQIKDLATGRTVFRNPMQHNQVSGGTGSTLGVSQKIFHLQHPKAVLSPGRLSAEVINRAAVNNALQLVLWFMVPADDAATDAPNQWNAVLARELQAQANAIGHQGAAAAAGAPVSPVISQDPPWIVMPRNALQLRFDNILPIPPAGTVDFDLINFVVPAGYTAAIKAHKHAYLGPGFNEGSGDLIWRILVDGAASPGFDSMATTISQPEPLPGAIIAESGQTVRYTVSTAPGFVGGDNVQAMLQGYFYPQQP